MKRRNFLGTSVASIVAGFTADSLYKTASANQVKNIGLLKTVDPKAQKSIYDVFNMIHTTSRKNYYTYPSKKHGHDIIIPYVQISQSISFNKNSNFSESKALEVLTEGMKKALKDHMFHLLICCGYDTSILSKSYGIGEKYINFASPEYIENNDKHNFFVSENGLGDTQDYQYYYDEYFSLSKVKELGISVKKSKEDFLWIRPSWGIPTICENNHIKYQEINGNMELVFTPVNSENSTCISGIMCLGLACLNYHNVTLLDL